ncbi:MAG TPA: spherulation-specific family 4 protein [Streptosporangiaceae bacterium]|nr:spherulation-specific family 4 protein [Streptosporangiaceae bacterium]
MRVFTISVAAAALLLGPAGAAQASTPTVCQRLVPSAYGPTVWAGAESSTPLPADVIANWGQGYDGAGGGPGLSKNAADRSTIRQATARGIRVLGYVWTDYANNARRNPVQPSMTPAPLRAVEKEAMDWYRWYGVTRLFFDGSTTGTDDGQLSYYRRLYHYVHDHIPGGRVWINPGWYPPTAAYMRVTDVLMDFESSYDTLAASPPPHWVYRYPARRFASALQLPDSQSSSLAAALALTRADNVGHVYIADQEDYSALPRYWNAENADVAAACGARGTQPTDRGPGGARRGVKNVVLVF